MKKRGTKFPRSFFLMLGVYSYGMKIVGIIKAEMMPNKRPKMKQKQRKRERERRIFRARETHVPSENPTGRLHSTWNLFPHSWQGILDGCSLPLRGGGAQGGKHFTIRFLSYV